MHSSQARTHTIRAVKTVHVQPYSHCFQDCEHPCLFSFLPSPQPLQWAMVSHVLSKYSATELHLCPFLNLILWYCLTKLSTLALGTQARRNESPGTVWKPWTCKWISGPSSLYSSRGQQSSHSALLCPFPKGWDFQLARVGILPNSIACCTS